MYIYIHICRYEFVKKSESLGGKREDWFAMRGHFKVSSSKGICQSGL